jgi:hypothetical protein
VFEDSKTRLTIRRITDYRLLHPPGGCASQQRKEKKDEKDDGFDVGGIGFRMYGESHIVSLHGCRTGKAYHIETESFLDGKQLGWPKLKVVGQRS